MTRQALADRLASAARFARHGGSVRHLIAGLESIVEAINAGPITEEPTPISEALDRWTTHGPPPTAASGISPEAESLAPVAALR